MALETLAKPEAISEERVRSIFYSSWDISQGNAELQSLLLARVFALHPEIYTKFEVMDMSTDSKMMQQIQRKFNNAHVAQGTSTSGVDETQNQINELKKIFNAESVDDIKNDRSLEKIAPLLLEKDYDFAEGRHRWVNGKETVVYKFYVIEHGIFREPYKGDRVWEEFFIDVSNFLDTYKLSKHKNKLGEFGSDRLQRYFAEYNALVQKGLYTNKRCKEIDYTGLTLFS